MAPPLKQGAEGKVELHQAIVPLAAPFAFATPTAFCCAAGSSICFVDIATRSRSYLHTNSYGITKICANPLRGLVAFCEAGTSPRVHVYKVEDRSLLFTFSGVTELELADMAFSRCGTRLYLLSRASSKRLLVYSTVTGEVLPGCDLLLPLRFEKVSVYPKHKDHIALVRSSNIRIVTMQKIFETYILKLHPATFATDIDLAVSAYAWAPSGHFLVATRQGTLCIVDGTNGTALHTCTVDQPITSLAVSQGCILMSSLDNELGVWSFDAARLPEGEAALGQQPSTSPMHSRGIFTLKRTIDFHSLQAGRRQEHQLAGSVAHFQIAPDHKKAVLTTSEGEAWAWQVPMNLDVVEPGEDKGPGDGDRLRLCAWCHTHPISDILLLGAQPRVAASCDDGGVLRIWELAKSGDPKGYRSLRFTSALTCLAADDDGSILIVGSESGCVHVVSCAQWGSARVVHTQRISESGVARICAVTHVGRCVSCAAVLLDNKIACFTVAFRDPHIRMQGFVDVLGSVEDIAFHTRDFNPQLVAPPRLIAGGSYRVRSEPEPVPCVWLVRLPPLDHDPSQKELTRDVCPVSSMRLSAGGLEGNLATVASASKVSIALGFAGGRVLLYPIPSAPGLPGKRMPVTEPEAELMPHEQLVSALQLSQDGSRVLSASMDGCIRLVRADGGGNAELQKTIHNPFTGGVSQVRATRDCGVIVSTGGTDGILCWGRPGRPFGIAPPALPAEPAEEVEVWEVDDTDTVALPVWQPTTAEEKLLAAQLETDNPELDAVVLAQRNALVLQVDTLRNKLQRLVELNAAAPELERLDRGEFCIDFEERDAIADTTRDRCNELRSQIERENLARQLIRHRLIKEFWDPMRTKGCLVSSLVPHSQLSVSNYPERKVSEEEKATVRKLQCMRKVERLEAQMLAGGGCPDELQNDVILTSEPFTTGREQYIVNWWAVGADKAAGGEDGGAKHESDKAEGEEGGDEGEEKKKSDEAVAGSAEPTDKQYLYEPFELMTNSRRRLQIFLLQFLAAEYRANFNELFKGGQKAKAAVLSEIKEKIARIRAIHAELHIEKDVREPEMHELEEEGAVLKVRDSEISAEKWISPEEKARLAEAAAKEEERQRQLRENDAGTRALMQMMGGTLKTKKDLSALERTIEKEPWMDVVPEEDMTELQLQAMREFQEKEKALAEEQDKYRKQLDAELKKCHSDVDDLAQQFEVTLKELHHQRFEHDAKFFGQELYCVRLQLALLQNAEDNNVVQSSFDGLHDAQERLHICEAEWGNFRDKVNVAKEKQDKRVQHEREISHSQHFKSQMAPFGLEPDVITKTLLPMFRMKRDAKPAEQEKQERDPRDQRHAGRNQRGSMAVNAPVTATLSAQSAQRQKPAPEPPAPAVPSYGSDPFGPATDSYPDLGTVQEPSIAEIVSEDTFHETCPEGVDDASFQKMLELRHERLVAEAEVQRGSAVLQEMGSLFSYYLRERDAVAGEYDQIQVGLDDHKSLMERELYDIELFFRLKQGQVEVQQAAVVTDYSDAIVIDKEVVESRNRRILELGGTKRGGLEHIKDFRKKLNKIQWELRDLELETLDLEERTKDVHMLRVTKDLQSMLKGGEESRNKADEKLLERKIEHLNHTTQQKEQSLKKQYGQGANAAKLRKMENNTLEKKLRELQQNVQQREHVRRLRPSLGGGGGGGGKEGEKPRIIGGGGRIEDNFPAQLAAQASFKEVRTRQSLRDTAQRHQEELTLLRAELERLRKRTFPSFVQNHQDPSMPDYR